SAAADSEQLGGTGSLRHRRHCARNGHMDHSAVGRRVAARLVEGVPVTTVPDRQAVRSVRGAADRHCHRAGTAAYAMIVFVLPDSYLPATVAIPALAVSAVVFGITRVQQGLFIAADAPGTVSTIEIIGTAAALLGSVMLITQFGMLGAAYGSIIGYSLCAVVGAIALGRVRSKRRPIAVDGAEDGDDRTGTRTSGLCDEPGDVVEAAGRSADRTKE